MRELRRTIFGVDHIMSNIRKRNPTNRKPYYTITMTNSKSGQRAKFSDVIEFYLSQNKSYSNISLTTQGRQGICGGSGTIVISNINTNQMIDVIDIIRNTESSKAKKPSNKINTLASVALQNNSENKSLS